jgi:hypothetical protein
VIEGKKGFSLGMSQVDHKATLWVRDLSQVIISPLLKSFLGFDKLNFPPRDYKAPYVADVTRGVNSLYVYCPLVEPRMVGDAQVPLKLNPFFIPFWCFMASNALTILFGDA